MHFKSSQAAETDMDDDRLWGPATGIDWCEEDYAITPYVAEFWNTVTNIGFIIVGIYCLNLRQRLRLPLRFLAAGVSLIGLGLTSGLFHATLWWTGQKLDEAFENIAMILLYHSEAKTQTFATLHCVLCVLGVFFLSFLLFVEIHIIGVASLGFLRIHQRVTELQQSSSGDAYFADKKESMRNLSLGHQRMMLCFIIAAICWVADNVFCGFIRQTIAVTFFNPQLHAWWHILTAIGFYQAVMIAAAGYLTIEPHGALARLKQLKKKQDDVYDEQGLGGEKVTIKTSAYGLTTIELV